MLNSRSNAGSGWFAVSRSNASTVLVRRGPAIDSELWLVLSASFGAGVTGSLVRHDDGAGDVVLVLAAANLLLKGNGRSPWVLADSYTHFYVADTFRRARSWRVRLDRFLYDAAVPNHLTIHRSSAHCSRSWPAQVGPTGGRLRAGFRHSRHGISVDGGRVYVLVAGGR